MRKIFLGVLVLILGLVTAQAQTRYTTIDVPNAVDTQLSAISPSGDISGRYYTANGTPQGLRHGFLFSKGKFWTIDYPGATDTDAAYINARGDIVGTHTDTNFRIHGHSWSKGKFTSIDYPGASDTIAWGISPSGQIVGVYTYHPGKDWQAHSYILSGGIFTPIPDFPGATETYATMMAGNLIVGFVKDLYGDGRYHGFLLHDGVFSVIDFPGSIFTVVSGLNPVGEMVGGYNGVDGIEHGFLFSDGNFITVEFPEWTSSYANGINSQGDIVGRYADSQGVEHGYLLRREFRGKN